MKENVFKLAMDFCAVLIDPQNEVEHIFSAWWFHLSICAFAEKCQYFQEIYWNEYSNKSQVEL